jgi:hypothetical protein
MAEFGRSDAPAKESQLPASLPVNFQERLEQFTWVFQVVSMHFTKD